MVRDGRGGRSHGPEVFIFPSGVAQSEYVLERETAAGMVGDGYRMVSRAGPWVLWKRTCNP